MEVEKRLTIISRCNGFPWLLAKLALSNEDKQKNTFIYWDRIRYAFDTLPLIITNAKKHQQITKQPTAIPLWRVSILMSENKIEKVHVKMPSGKSIYQNVCCNDTSPCMTNIL